MGEVLWNFIGTTMPSDGTYQFDRDTGTTKWQYSLTDGEYGIYVTIEPGGRYTRFGVLISSNTGGHTGRNHNIFTHHN